MIKYSSTARTIYGFLRSFLRRRLPYPDRSDQLDDIYNYLSIENLFATSGQPSEAQFRLIKEACYESVINLAPIGVLENSVVDEAEILENLELEYIHIPVDFGNPSESDFRDFTETLERSRRVWVHCAAKTRWPSAANRRAVARPIPELAPVTKTSSTVSLFVTNSHPA